MSNIRIHRRIVQLKDINIFYRDTETEGQSILCLHGRWGRGETWIDFMQQYGNKYRIIAPDLRGHGLSDKPNTEYTADEMAEDMIQLLNHLKLESVIIIGHSMGGHVAGYLTATYPKIVKALAILDKSSTVLINDSTGLNDEIELVDPITKDWPLPFLSLKEAKKYIKKSTDSDLSFQYFMNSLIETVEGYTMMFSPLAMAKNIASYKDWSELLPRFHCPVMLLRSTKSGAVSDADFDSMATMIPNCLAFEVQNPDHNVHLADEQGFYRFFEEFMNTL